jgi:prefoldin alpha subunit
MATPEAMVEEISKLSVEQLRQVKEQVDGEVSVLQDSLTNIRTAANRFEMASKALNMLSQQPPGRV